MSDLQDAVTRQWLGFLIDHAAWLPDGLMKSITPLEMGAPRRSALKDVPWLENYTGYAVYQLGRNGWSADQGEENLRQWESGAGDPIELRSSVLYSAILELVLPRIAERRLFTWNGTTLIYPPIRDWQQVLQFWTQFISHPAHWSPFVEYSDDIAELLFHQWGGRNLLNIRYQDRFAGFTRDEINDLPSLLYRIVFNRGFNKQTVLSEDEAALLDRIIDVAGDLKVDSSSGHWRLHTFRTVRAVATY